MSVCTSTVEDTTKRVLELAREIESLSVTDLPFEEFFKRFLNCLVQAVGARAGAVWMKDDSGRLELFCENRLKEVELEVAPGAWVANEQLVLRVMGDGQTLARAASQTKLPTDDQLIIVPLRRAKTSVGAVEIFQRAEAHPAAFAGYQEFVEEMCGYASRYLNRGMKKESTEGRSEAADRREQFLLQLHGSLIANEVAAIAASDGRQVIGCDRAAVAIRRGPKTVVLAISGQGSVNRRAKLVRLMEQLVSSVIDARKPLVYTGTLENLAPQIENPLAEYIQESGARMVIIVPLLEPTSNSESGLAADGRKATPKKVIGGLVVEQFASSRPALGVKEHTSQLVEHISSALHNARTHERLLLTPVRRLLGNGRSLWEGRLWLKVAAILAGICALTTTLVVVPYNYRVESKGRLMPVLQRSVFAPVDSDVVEVLVASADRVSEGQPLLRLGNDQLHAKLLEARNKLLDSQNRLRALQAELDEAVGNSDRKVEVRLEGEIVKASVEIDGAQNQVRILEREESHLLVRAPINGTVVTFQLDQLLKNRPVRRGELLVEVMDESGPWRLELEVEEKRMGHLLRATKQSESINLPLEFVLATNVESTYAAQIEHISTRADESESGNIVEILAAIDASELPDRQIGAEVIAKTNCGKRSLGYVLFGDVIEFLQKHLGCNCAAAN